MNSPVPFPGFGPLLAVLLITGHALADFALQTRGMVRNKHRFPGLAAHIGVVFVVQAALLLPVLSLRMLVVVAGITVAHGIIDRTKAAVSARSPGRGLEWFLADQFAHLAVLAVAWTLMRSDPGVPLLPGLLASGVVSPGALGAAAVLVAAYAFNFHGASAIVMAVLERYQLTGERVPATEAAPAPDASAVPAAPTSSAAPVAPAAPPSPARGQAIGILERWIVLTLVMAGQWGALGLLLAAKSVARFRDLEDRDLSEYYLIGTLTSVLLATATALLVGAVLPVFR